MLLADMTVIFKTARPVIYGSLYISRAIARQPDLLLSPLCGSSVFLFAGKCNQNITPHHCVKLAERAQRSAKNGDDVCHDDSCPTGVDFAQ